jgi:hypothetical protein
MIGHPDFPRMVWSVYYFLFHVFIKEVTVLAGHEVLVEVDDNNVAIDDDLMQILFLIIKLVLLLDWTDKFPGNG